MPSPDWFRSAPSLVAESLRSVADPLAAWLRPGPSAPPSAVAAALAHALLPPEAPTEPPPWLRPDQRLSFQRTLAAVERFGGALLADGVGTGKTYVSLAVAKALDPARAVHVLAPASLFRQWSEAGRRTGISLRLHSHETLSRGRVPASERGAVIIDECHRFRNPATRRYQTLAPWLVERRGLLLSATPAVNRLTDVAHQLLLLVQDDALAWAGTRSLLAGLDESAPGALAHLVVTGEDRSRFLPVRAYREVCAMEPPASPWESIADGIDALQLSRNPAVARLVKIILFQALASSPAALADALRKYQGLLLHARDAGPDAALTRGFIRAMTGAELDQLVLWPLLAGSDASPLPDLVIDDIERVGCIERIARECSTRADPKLMALRELVADGRPTLVFTTLIATARHLRRQLGARIAWCTGAGAGLGGSRLPRDQVLDWFRTPTLPVDAVAARPSILVATDMASEGLDLPRIERVVHYDLPWTALRLEQRSGRAVRLGGLQQQVEVVRFRPPSRIEAVLDQERILETKSALTAALGLDAGSDAPWRLRARIAATWLGVPAAEGVASIPGAESAVVAGFRIGGKGGLSQARHAASLAPVREVVLARVRNRWTDSPAVIAELLEPAREARALTLPRPAAVKSALRTLLPVVRKALRTAYGATVAGGANGPHTRSALRRLMVLAHHSARARAISRMRHVEAGIRFLRRGHTAGEARIAERWAALPEPQLLAELAGLEEIPAADPAEAVELIGMLLITR